MKWMSTLSGAPGPRLLGVALLVTLASGCAGCGGGSHSRGADPPSSTHRQTTRVRHTDTTTTTGPPTNPATDPTTTDGTTTTSDLPGTGKPTLTIGDKNDTEQFLLGRLYQQALQAQGYTVNITQNIGPTAVTVQALKKGSLDMYPEYLDTFDADIAGLHRGFRDMEGAYVAALEYAAANGLQLLVPTPFSDTYAVGVTDYYAQRHHLTSLGDLRRVAPALTLGGASIFEHTDPGLPALARAYRVTPQAFKSLGVGDQYDDLDDGTIQAAFVSTTDGQLASGNYRLLRDPRRIFGYGNIVPVVTSDTAASEGPAFVNTINHVDALLSTGVMRQLNALVDIAQENPSAVAKQFLQTHGLLPTTS